MELSPSWEAINCAAILELVPAFTEPEGSLPCSREFTDSYPKPDQSSPYHHILSLQDSCPCYQSAYVLVLLVGFSIWLYHQFKFSPIVLHALPLIILGEEYKLRTSLLCSFSTVQSLRPSAKIFPHPVLNQRQSLTLP
jgi:hypothetical protein